jgi:putative ABC transport system substrate-binding protein
MNRRAFLMSAAGLGLSVTAACGFSALAPTRRVYRIGYLAVATAQAAAVNLAAFRDGLRELGLVEGQSITLDVRFAEGREDRLPELAQELLALGVAVLLTDGNNGIRAARAATSTTPIVFTIADDPVADGIVQSMARPGGNATELTSQAGNEEAKRLELLKEVVPEMSQAAVLWTQAAAGRFQQLLEAAPSLGVKLAPVQLRRPEDLESSLASVAGVAEAMVVIGVGGIFAPLLTRVVEFTSAQRWPSISTSTTYARAGGLMSLGANTPELYRRAASYVDRILKGADPAELPVERPSRIDFLVNRRTAQALGLSIPANVLAQATEIIE